MLFLLEAPIFCCPWCLTQLLTPSVAGALLLFFLFGCFQGEFPIKWVMIHQWLLYFTSHTHVCNKITENKNYHQFYKHKYMYTENHVHYNLCTSKIWLLESRFLFYTDCHTLRFLQFFRRGIPESWLCRRYSCSRFGRFPRSSGRCVSWLWVTSRHFRASKVKQMLLFIKNSSKL